MSTWNGDFSKLKVVKHTSSSNSSRSGWFTEKEIERFRVYVEFKMNEKGLKSNFTVVHADRLEYLFELYDTYLFDNRISAKLKALNSTLTFETKIASKEGIMGFFQYDKSHGSARCNYKLNLPSERFSKLFSAGESSYSANGLHCKTKLECYIVTFEHEFCHLLHHILVDFTLASTSKKYTMAHGRLFMCLVKKLFYHKDYRHAILGGLDSTNTLSKETTHLGQIVALKDRKTNKEYTCKVMAKNPRMAVLECFLTKNGKIDQTVPPVIISAGYNRIRSTDLDETEISFLQNSPVRLTPQTAHVGQIITVQDGDKMQKGIIIDKKRTNVVFLIYKQNDKGEIIVPRDTRLYKAKINVLFKTTSTPNENAIAQDLISRLTKR